MDIIINQIVNLNNSFKEVEKMSEIFKLEDVFNIMIELELFGNRHYKFMEKLTTDIKLKVLFEDLANAEAKHKIVYEELKEKVINFNREKVDVEYEEYIKTLLENAIEFLRENQAIDDFEKGYKIAIKLEEDTINFLTELKSILESNFEIIIDEIIVQEKSHLKSLEDFKSKFE